MKKLALLILSVFVANTLLLTTALPAYAANTTLKETTFSVSDILSTDDKKPEYFEKATDANPPIILFIIRVIDFATKIIGSIAVIIMIFAGFKFMTAQGNDQRITEAKEVFKYAVIGLLVTFLSYVIITSIQAIFLSQEV